jgi:hypothetical protein
MHATDAHWRTHLPTIRLIAALIIFLHSASLLGASYGGAEIKPFGLLDADASLSIRYLLNENSRKSDSGPTSFENRSTWEEELFLVSRSYVYHPGFLNMEFGGGPLLVQQQFDNDAGSNSNNETLLNLLARLNFLDLKSYPFSLYFQRNHPSVTTSLSGRFLTVNEEYGLTGRKAFTDWNSSFTYELSRRDQEGSGFETVLDEELDRKRFKFSKNYGEGDRISIDHNRLDRISRSGSLGLPIQESRNKRERTHVAAQNRFGGERQFSLHQSMVQLKHQRDSGTSSRQDDLSYTASGRWRNSGAVQSTFNYRFNTSERAESDVESHVFDTGFTHHVNDKLWYDALAGHEDLEQTGFQRKRSGIGGSVNFSEATRFGSFGLSGSLRQERTDQESTEGAIQVFDERVTLTGTTPVDLANEFILPGTVAVTNSAGTQVFIEDVDYRLIIVGSVTSIQRLIDGNIFDGQTVLVDYQYLTSGTVKFDRLSANATASLEFLQHFYARFRYGQTDSDIISGELTTPINDRQLFEVVLGGDIPVFQGWNFGAELRHVDQDEEIAPFVSDSVAVSMSGNIIGSMSLRVGAGLTKVDQKKSIEDVDQVTFRLSIRGRVFGQAYIGYAATYLEDSGGSLPREQYQHRFSLQGRYRQMLYSLEALYSDDTLGVTERSSRQVTAIVTRYF